MNSNDFVGTGSARKNNEFSIYEQSFSTYHSFKIYFKTNTDTTAQLLQYRILHRVVPVYYYVKKIKTITEDFFTF